MGNAPEAFVQRIHDKIFKGNNPCVVILPIILGYDFEGHIGDKTGRFFEYRFFHVVKLDKPHLLSVFCRPEILRGTNHFKAHYAQLRTVPHLRIVKVIPDILHIIMSHFAGEVPDYCLTQPLEFLVPSFHRIKRLAQQPYRNLHAIRTSLHFGGHGQQHIVLAFHFRNGIFRGERKAIHFPANIIMVFRQYVVCRFVCMPELFKGKITRLCTYHSLAVRPYHGKTRIEVS